MNTIRSARTRPRKDSVNFRSLWWALTRAACWHVRYGPSSPAKWPRLAEEFAQSQSTPLVNKTRRVLASSPELGVL